MNHTAALHFEELLVQLVSSRTFALCEACPSHKEKVGECEVRAGTRVKECGREMVCHHTSKTAIRNKKCSRLFCKVCVLRCGGSWSPSWLFRRANYSIFLAGTDDILHIIQAALESVSSGRTCARSPRTPQTVGIHLGSCSRSCLCLGASSISS